MKLETVKRNVSSSGTMEVSTAKIKATSKLFDMFADQTYANKPVAILRELVSNGIDAHTAAGKPEVPVEITLPSEFDPMFKVKDFGTGMPHDFVMGPFMEYTNGSTKDQSNDQIGGFGIGSKSPFAYCDQFTLRVVHDGVLSVYTMFKNDESIPAIGLQGQTTTDEDNGVEVSFPIEVDDIEQFQEAAQQALQYFQPLPIVHNGTLSPPDYTHVSVKGHWAMKASPDGTLGVIMGGVRYPVTSDALSYSVRGDSRIAPLLNYGIDITVPIGTCDVAMSREALSYTDRTNEGIRNALGAIVDEVADTFAHLFDGYKTWWEASVGLYQQLAAINGGRTLYHYSNSPRATMLKSYAKWKGQQLELSKSVAVERTYDNKTGKYVEKPAPDYPQGAQAWQVPQVQSWMRTFPNSKFVTLQSLNQITPGQYEVVFVDDMEVSPKSRTAARVREFFERNKDKYPRSKMSLVLRANTTTDKKDIDKMLAFLGRPPKIIYLSKMPEPARVQRTIIKGGATVARPKVRMFKFNGDTDIHGDQIWNLHPAHAKRKAVSEIPEADQPQKGIMVIMDYFKLPPKLHEKMATGLIKWDELIFVNQADAKALKKTFKTFETVFDKKFKVLEKKYPNVAASLAIAEDRTLSDLFSKIKLIKENKIQIPADKRTKSFGKILALYEQHVETLTPEARAVARVLGIVAALPDNVSPNELYTNFKKEHPFAYQLDHLLGSWQMKNPEVLRLFIHNL